MKDMEHSWVWWILLGAGLATVGYRVGYLAGADDGWWSCMAEHGEVA